MASAIMANAAEFTAKETAIVDIGAWTARGEQDKLGAAFKAGFGAGLTLNEAKELVGQLYAYCGFPRALNAAATLMGVWGAGNGERGTGKGPSPFSGSYNALRDGNIVSMPADRVFGSTKALAVNFMGGVADLPIGPFQMAVTRDVRLVPIFVMKERWDTYRIISRIFEPDATLPKRERMQRLAQQFADMMAEVIGRYPTQWFNYFEFVR